MLQTNTLNTLIGKVRKRDRNNTTMRHYKLDDLGSPLIPCTGCTESRHNDGRGNICIIEAVNTELISIPVKHSTISGRSTIDARRLRTLISPDSLHTIQENITG